MKGNCFLNNYLDPIAKVWSSAQIELPSKRVKSGLKKKGLKKVKK